MAWFRKKMWLAVEGGWQGWIDTPNSGADASATGWNTDATFLSGGGYADRSWGTHKRYAFEWSAASSRQAAQFMQDLRNGSHGTGLIRFIEPTLYDTNVLPARIASPALITEDEGDYALRNARPRVTDVSVSRSVALPRRAATWDLPAGETGRDAGVGFLIPVPEGYDLAIGAIYTTSGPGRFQTGLFVSQGGQDDMVPASDGSDEFIIKQDSVFSRDTWARIWVGKTTTAPSSISVSAIVARYIPKGKRYSILRPGYGYGDQPYGEGPYGGVRLTTAFNKLRREPWIGGMGNSGVEFNGVPTLTHNTGVDGGQVGFAASFIETGAWL